MNINSLQSLNGMTIVGQKQEVVNISGGIENESRNKTGKIENENAFIFVKKKNRSWKMHPKEHISIQTKLNKMF